MPATICGFLRGWIILGIGMASFNIFMSPAVNVGSVLSAAIITRNRGISASSVRSFSSCQSRCFMARSSFAVAHSRARASGVRRTERLRGVGLRFMGRSVSKPSVISHAADLNLPFTMERFPVLVRLLPYPHGLFGIDTLQRPARVVVERYPDRVRLDTCLMHPQVIVRIGSVEHHALVEPADLLPTRPADHEATEVRMRALPYHAVPVQLRGISNADRSDELAGISSQHAHSRWKQLDVIIYDHCMIEVPEHVRQREVPAGGDAKRGKELPLHAGLGLQPVPCAVRAAIVYNAQLHRRVLLKHGLHRSLGERQGVVCQHYTGSDAGIGEGAFHFLSLHL